MRLEPLATPAGTGAILTYVATRRAGLRAAVFTPGVGWSKPEPAGGYDPGYRLLTSRSAAVAAIVEEDSGGPPRIRLRDPGGRFAASALPLPADHWVDDDHVGMGGDGSLYLPFVESADVDTGVPGLPRYQAQQARVLVRAPGGGWVRIEDVARLVDRAAALVATPPEALAMLGSQLEIVATLRADASRVLVLWRRDGMLEGALGSPAGFDPPFSVAGDTASIGEVRDAAAADGRLLLVADQRSPADAGTRGGPGAAVLVWHGPLGGPLQTSPLPGGLQTVGVSDRAVVSAVTATSRAIAIQSLAAGGSWRRATGILRSATLGGGRNAYQADTTDASGTRTVAAVSVGLPRTPQLFDVDRGCPDPLPPEFVCPVAGANAVLHGPVWLQGPTAVEDATGLPPLVRLLDRDVPLVAWAATRLRSDGREQRVIYASRNPQQTTAPVRVQRYAVRLAGRHCSLGRRRCARVAFVSVRLDADARVGIVTGRGGVAVERFAAAGRTMTVKLLLRPGRHVISLAIPTLVDLPRRTVTVT